MIIVLGVYFFAIPYVVVKMTEQTYGIEILPDGTATGINPQYMHIRRETDPSSTYYNRIVFAFVGTDGNSYSHAWIPTNFVEDWKKPAIQDKITWLQKVSANVQLNKLGLKGFWWF